MVFGLSFFFEEYYIKDEFVVKIKVESFSKDVVYKKSNVILVNKYWL